MMNLDRRGRAVEDCPQRVRWVIWTKRCTHPLMTAVIGRINSGQINERLFATRARAIDSKLAPRHEINW